MRKNGETISWRKTCNDCGRVFVDSMTTLAGKFPMRARDFKADTGQCPECKEGRELELEKTLLATTLNWTPDEIKAHLLTYPPYKDQELIVHDASAGMNTYALVKVVNPEHTKQKRIVIEGYTNEYSGMSFYRNGVNCYAPKGQVRLLPYNETIGNLIKKEITNWITLSNKEIVDLVGTREVSG